MDKGKIVDVVIFASKNFVNKTLSPGYFSDNSIMMIEGSNFRAGKLRESSNMRK